MPRSARRSEVVCAARQTHRGIRFRTRYRRRRIKCARGRRRWNNCRRSPPGCGVESMRDHEARTCLTTIAGHFRGNHRTSRRGRHEQRCIRRRRGNATARLVAAVDRDLIEVRYGAGEPVDLRTKRGDRCRGRKAAQWSSGKIAGGIGRDNARRPDLRRETCGRGDARQRVGARCRADCDLVCLCCDCAGADCR